MKTKGLLEKQLTEFDRKKEKIDMLEEAIKYARSSQEALSIQYEINRLKSL